MMGLDTTVYWLHWVLLYLIVYFSMTLVLTYVVSSGLFVYSSFSVLAMFFFLYLLSLLSYGLLMSVFFKRANSAATVSMIVNLSLFFVNSFKTDSHAINMLLCLLSPVSFSKGLGVVGAAEGGQVCC